MANKTASILQQSWIGGLANDEFAGSPNQFSACSNIDYISSPRYIQTSNSLSSHFASASATSKLFVGQDGALYTFCTGGQLYRGTSLYLTGPWSGAYFINAENFTANNIVIVASFATTYAIYRLNMTTNVITTISTGTLGHTTLPLPMTVFNDQCLIGNGSDVISVSLLMTVSPTPALILDDGADCVFMTYIQDQVYIFAYQGLNGDGDSIQYIRNGVDTTVLSKVKYIGYRVRGGVNINNQIHLVGGSFTPQTVYSIVNGTQKTDIYKNKYQSELLELDGNINQLYGYENMIYGSGNHLGVPGVFLGGSYYQGYPNQIGFVYGRVNDINCIVCSGNNLYIGDDQGVKRVLINQYYDGSQSKANGTIISCQYDLGNMGVIKQIDNSYIVCEIEGEDDSLSLDVSLDGGAWTHVRDITQSDMANGPRVKIFPASFIASNLNRQFSFMQYRLRLNPISKNIKVYLANFNLSLPDHA